MKKVCKQMFMTFMALATIGLAGCKKDPIEEPVNPGGQDTTPQVEQVSLAGTSWVGVFNDQYTQDGQSYPAVLTWSLDFNNDTTGELFFELVVAGMNQASVNIPFTYTFDGHEGLLNAGAEIGVSQFVYDSAANTITAMLMVGVEGTDESLGGNTVFYPRGENPGGGETDTTGGVTPGEITDEFPAGTRWTASEETVYPAGELGELPMTLVYTLFFNNDHTGSLDVTVTVLGQTAEPQRVMYNWEYDSVQHKGNFIVRNVPLPFTYDPANNTITTEFNFDVQGGGTAGGQLTFTQVTSKNGKRVKIMLGR